jgi:FkbH-like protein
MRRIASELNLKTKDFLFLDDRAEERAIMQEVMPEVLCVDPDAAGVWRRLQLVPTLLPKQDELDRTLTYHQQAKRQQALHATQQDVEDQSPVLRKLEIGVHIRAAAAKDLERVVELINRTNQFNLCGSRTYLAEAKRWQQSPRHRILMVDAQDKFGKMGAVSVAVVARTSDCLDILVFVLSCRAFGFGIETALLNTVRHIADCASRIAGGLPLPVHGRYIETPANDPCRHVYQRHGFALAGDAWVYHCGASVHDPEHDPDQDPEWLSVTREPIEGLAISG